ncbi:unnamed protein product, partial [Trichobilharzia regenti]
VDLCLQEISNACSSDDRKQNLLALCIEAARARCTIGEITDAMVKVYGRHKASDHLVSGAYRSQFGVEDEWKNVINAIEVNFVLFFLNLHVFVYFCLLVTFVDTVNTY